MSHLKGRISTSPRRVMWPSTSLVFVVDISRRIWRLNQVGPSMTPILLPFNSSTFAMFSSSSWNIRKIFRSCHFPARLVGKRMLKQGLCQRVESRIRMTWKGQGKSTFYFLKPERIDPESPMSGSIIPKSLYQKRKVQPKDNKYTVRLGFHIATISKLFYPNFERIRERYLGIGVDSCMMR